MPFVAIPRKVQARAIDLELAYRNGSEYERGMRAGFMECAEMLLPRESYLAILSDACCYADHGHTITENLPRLAISPTGAPPQEEET